MAEQISLSRLATGNENRDAVHVAVAVGQASEDLQPGQHIGKLSNGKFGPCGRPCGVVSPFLKSYVPAGAYFPIMLYPGVVLNLRHHWDHVDFPDKIVEEYDEDEDYSNECRGCFDS